MQEIESTKQNIDLQPNQIKQESFDSLINQISDNCQPTNSKKIDNRFQASLERQRNLLLNMEQQLAIYPQQHLTTTTSTSSNDPPSSVIDEDKAMDIQVDNNNNTMLFNSSSFNRPSISLPSIYELKNLKTTTNCGQIGLNFSPDNLLVNSDKKSRSNMILSTFNQTNGQFNDSEFGGHFEDEDYSRLSHINTSLYENYDLNQSIKMEDAFQDDKLDFKTGPTLAELNLNDDDMMDNLPTVCVNPNSVLCPSMPLQASKNGFLMGINYTIGLTSTISSSTTTTTQADSNRTDLVSSDDRFSLKSHQLNHLSTTSTNNGSTKQNNGFNRSTNQQAGNQTTNGKQSYNTRKRGRNKSESDKPIQRRTNNNQNSQNNLSQSNQVLCKLLNEKNDNPTNCLNSNIYLVNATESHPLINNAIASNGQSIPSTSNSSSFQTTICVSPLSGTSTTTQLSPNLSNKSISPNQLSPLQNDLLLNQLQTTINQPIKCGLQANLRLNSNNSAARDRNSSISTEHSFSSSHDEGRKGCLVFKV